MIFCWHKKYRRHSWFSFIRIRRNFIFHRRQQQEWKHDRRLRLCVTYWSLMNSEQILHSKLNQLFEGWSELVQLTLNATFWCHHVTSCCDVMKFCFILFFVFLCFGCKALSLMMMMMMMSSHCCLYALCVSWSEVSLLNSCSFSVMFWTLVSRKDWNCRRRRRRGRVPPSVLRLRCTVALCRIGPGGLKVYSASLIITFVVMTKRLNRGTGSDTCPLNLLQRKMLIWFKLL